jgi:hypothetical protein
MLRTESSSLERSLAEVFCAGLGGRGGIAVFIRRRRGAVGYLELIAEAVPATQSVAVSLAVSLGDGAEIVGAIAKR